MSAGAGTLSMRNGRDALNLLLTRRRRQDAGRRRNSQHEKRAGRPNPLTDPPPPAGCRPAPSRDTQVSRASGVGAWSPAFCCSSPGEPVSSRLAVVLVLLAAMVAGGARVLISTGAPRGCARAQERPEGAPGAQPDPGGARALFNGPSRELE